MINEEAINQIEEFMVIDDWSLVYMPQLHEALGVAIEALKEQSKWAYLKEHITDMRDADGESKLTQKQICQFILNLMSVIEGEGNKK